MELRHLRYFMKAAELLHFTQAAAALHVSQPTLSLQIRQLENELGTRLFERKGRTVHLTEVGELFLGYTRRALNEVDAGLQGIQELNGLLRGTLRIGVSYSYSARLLPEILAEFVRSYPTLHVVVSIMANRSVEEGIKAGDIDLGLVCQSSNAQNFGSLELFKEEIVAVVSPKHPLGRTTALRLRDLEKVRLALPTSDFRTRQFIDLAFAAAKIKPEVVLEANHIDVLLEFAKRGAAAILVNRLAVAHLSSDQISIIRLKEKELLLTAAFIWPLVGLRPAAKRFLELATDHVAKKQGRTRNANSKSR